MQSASPVRRGRQVAITPRRVAVGAVGVAAAGFVYYAADTTQGFLTVTNLKAILASVAFVGMVAIASALVMISGNLFSLSAGATAVVTAIAFLALLPHGIVLAVVLPLLLGVAVGFAQGFVVGSWGANAIIVTVAAASLLHGFTLWATGGKTIVAPIGDTSYQFINRLIGGIPFPVYVLLVVGLLAELLLRRTRFGREVYLSGENRIAARAAGLRTGAGVAGAFALGGLCLGIAGVELGAFNGYGSLTLEGTLTYDGIAAAVVGGVAITGGRGTIIGALGGSILIASVSDLLLLRGYDQGIQILVKGIIVFVVVCGFRLNRAWEGL